MFAGLFPNPGTGSILKLAPGGGVSSLATGPLVFPNGITVGPNGVLYVSVNSVCDATPGGDCGPFTGGVVKITP
jgi:sugar lactone lactonase YvrE